MKFRLVSDLHLEFYPDAESAQPLVESLACDGVETCVLAGDIVAANCLDRVTWLTSRYPDTKFLWVPGNHEYYGGSLDRVDARMRELADATPNLFLLDCARHGRFVGATLWYPEPAALWDWLTWSDHRAIVGAVKLFEKAERHREFLQNAVQSEDIVVTHMLPHPAAVAPRWHGHDSNAYFVHNMSALIEDRQPLVWCFGHTHDSVDVHVGRTRLLCNPAGYHPNALNPDFDPALTVEVGTQVASEESC